jgi:hypothetical protein
MSQTLIVKASIHKPVITRHDRHLLCLQLISSIMSIPVTEEIKYVQELCQQGPDQESVVIAQEQRSLSYA